jgi:hypothetical protein
MAVTTNYGWPYPELTDEPDGRAQIAALATAADADLKALADDVEALGGDVGPVDPDPAPEDATGGRYVNTTAQNIPITVSGPGTVIAFPAEGGNTPAPTDVTRAVSTTGHVFTLGKGGVWWAGATVRIASAAAAGECSCAIRADLAGGTSYTFTVAFDGGRREGLARSLEPGQATYLPQGTKIVVQVFNGTGSTRVTEPDAGAWVHLDLFRIG